MPSNFEMIRAHFDSRSLEYNADVEEGLFGVILGLNNLSVAAVVHAEEGAPEIVIALRLLMSVPAEERAAVAEFFTRLNFESRFGVFLLDLDDGEMRYRVSLPSFGEPVPESLFAGCFMRAAVIVDGVYPVLIKVLGGGLPPASAVEQAEASLNAFLQQLNAREERPRGGRARSEGGEAGEAGAPGGPDDGAEPGPGLGPDGER